MLSPCRKNNGNLRRSKTSLFIADAFSLPLFSFSRMRIYYNVFLLSDFSSSFKNMFFNTFVNQRFIKMFKENAKKSPYIFGLYVIKFLPLHPLSKSKQRWLTLFLESGSVNESFLCSSFRKRDDGKKER